MYGLLRAVVAATMKVNEEENALVSFCAGIWFEFA